jgi:hypothetical protein
MRDLLLLAIHLLVTLAKLLRPGGVRAVATEPLLLKHQLVSMAQCPGARRHHEFPLARLASHLGFMATGYVFPAPSATG